jgi:hypothetical protein
MRAEPAPLADAVDVEMLGALHRAGEWWRRQPTWHVSSSHTGGGVVAALERAVAQATGGRRALALPSGTAAVAAALRALGLQRGDCIGVPELDWTATNAVASALGLRTVPLPVDETSGLLDSAAAARQAAGLAAVVVVHLHGLTCDLRPLLADLPEVPLVEDAARAWGARCPDGTAVGSAGTAAAFSFGSGKRPAGGELGCLVTATGELHREAVALTQHPTRQLLEGISRPRHDIAMERAAPASALLAAHAIAQHESEAQALRRAAARVAARLRRDNVVILSDPFLNAPGVLAVRTPVSLLERALASLDPQTAALVVSAGPADVRPHPGVGDRRRRCLLRLARDVSVVNVAATLHGR